ncbi:LysR family transcriptional regulator [Lactobacillus sp. ESL0681]|uniref:LysR family transcriptional regulator n=1 Tax=Lactobacillus sp. ESL0681 TaxID=2983211 RepID=UPI0023FA4269|nr:LysR family transcriptional regulator [Lactobacillus sp. ESL0681]WEV39904.1 LysR family transcriptional regulator [Lactobacillus sp. ESL0681]
MNIEYLKTFLQVVQLGSFEKVAKINYQSQRAISKQITHLENELGTKLFDRSSNKIFLTPQGRVFCSSAQDIINNLNDAIADLHYLDDKEGKILRVGYFSAFEGKIVQKSLYSLMNEEPQVNIVIHEESNERLMQNVINGNLDVVFSINYGKTCVPESSSLSNTVVYRNNMVMGVSKLNPLSQERVLLPEMIKSIPIIYYCPENSTFLLECFLASLVKIPDHQEIKRVSSTEQMHMLVSLNKAIAFYPSGLISRNEMLNDSEVKYCEFCDNDSQNYEIVAVYKRDNKNKMLKKLINILNKDKSNF